MGDSARPYVVDSVQISLNLIRRDTLLDGLNFYVYRIDPATTDSEATFASITSQFVPEALIDSIHVPDTLNSGLVRTVLRGADVAKVALPVEGDGVLAIGVAMSAPEPSGARLGALLAQSGPTFISYVTVDTPDTGTVRKQTLTAQTTFNTYVLAAPQTPDPDLLTVGGEPSSRALLRFAIPRPIKDSGTIVRATLELIPVAPVIGLRTDPPLLEARSLFADLGAKSPVVTTDSPVHHLGHDRGGQRGHGPARRDGDRAAVADDRRATRGDFPLAPSRGGELQPPGLRLHPFRDAGPGEASDHLPQAVPLRDSLGATPPPSGAA